VSAFYPLGDGVSANAIEEGQLVGAFGRTATATIRFDIDDQGVPGNFQVEKSSADIWGPEAIRIARAWRFKPGIKDGKSVVVPAAFAFAWGQKELPPSQEAEKPYGPTFDAHPPIVFQIAPDYPADARASRTEGTVVLSLVVDENGDPRNVTVIESLGHGLNEAAISAVSTWKFQPVILNGHAEAVPSTVRVDFRLPK
jgi:TonB family protein